MIDQNLDAKKEGLEEAIAYEKGSEKAKEKTYMIIAVKEYDGKEIRDRDIVVMLASPMV